jgi:hypothetical protein
VREFNESSGTFYSPVGGNDYLDTPNLVVCNGEPILKVTRVANEELNVEAEVFDDKGIRKRN